MKSNKKDIEYQLIKRVSQKGNNPNCKVILISKTNLKIILNRIYKKQLKIANKQLLNKNIKEKIILKFLYPNKNIKTIKIIAYYLIYYYPGYLFNGLNNNYNTKNNIMYPHKIDSLL